LPISGDTGIFNDFSCIEQRSKILHQAEQGVIFQLES